MEELRWYAIDWSGEQMPDDEPAKGEPTAGTIRKVADEIERLRAELAEAKAATAAAVKAERERCAAIADGWSVSIMGASEDSTVTTKHAEEIAQSVPPAMAAAIRGGDNG